MDLLMVKENCFKKDQNMKENSIKGFLTAKANANIQMAHFTKETGTLEQHKAKAKKPTPATAPMKETSKTTSSTAEAPSPI